MTGPEHYLEAERLIASAEKCKAEADRGHDSHLRSLAFFDLQKAQVHATLAAAAAAGVCGTASNTPPTDRQQWRDAASLSVEGTL